jgi:nucleoside-diphosphate-sugar epimerase
VARTAASPLADELDELLGASVVWPLLAGARLFVTGGTGFVGCWLLESILWADARFALDVQVTVLTRSPDAFRRRAPHLAGSPRVQLHEGDVRDFTWPGGRYSHVVHAATETNTDLSHPDALTLYSASADGTRHVLEFARASGVEDMLLVSSGAVYGRQPTDLPRIAEDYAGAASCLDVGAGYGNGKRAAEFLSIAYQQRYGIRAKIARCFAFVGPYLPIDSGFAIGNFIADALEGRDVRVNGDGTPKRSYLYAADLAEWLWTILVRGEPGRAYNVGAEDDHSILDVARLVASVVAPEVSVVRAREPAVGVPAERYVPCTGLARAELGLVATVALDDAVRRTASWHRHRAASVAV